MTLAEVAALVAGGTGVLTAWSAYRKTSVDHHATTINGLQVLTRELRDDLDRERTMRRALATELEQTRKMCEDEISELKVRHEREVGELRVTVASQAQKLARLEGDHR